MMGHNKGLHMVTFTLLVIGGLNWLLAVWSVDIAHWGLPLVVVQVVYVLVGLSAIYELITHGSHCRECKPDGMGMNK